MRSNKIAYFFLALAAVLAIAAIGLLLFKPGKSAAPALTSAAKSIENAPMAGRELKLPPEDPGKTAELLHTGLASRDPADLLGKIANAMEQGDFASVRKLVGKEALDAGKLLELDALAAGGALRVRTPGGIREIGELELNKLARWSIRLADREAGSDRINFDLRNQGGKWSVEKIFFPQGAGTPVPETMTADSLGTADAFLEAILRQDFELAREFADPARVSEAKIAALCILFEEGEYRLRASRPIRAMFDRGDTVGYIANVESADAGHSAQFALTLQRLDSASKWQVSEINLDELLEEYAGRVAGGDVYYSPLVKNPAGGETLALYFEFDEDSVSPRTRRQLEVVVQLLKSDPARKITLSGHTDALGTPSYNDTLSSNRAQVVREYLTKAGVSGNQVITLAKGASQPRRPNVTETGEDDPQGRRANRRTEIYLDF